jgi:hypothetical protein
MENKDDDDDDDLTVMRVATSVEKTPYYIL